MKVNHEWSLILILAQKFSDPPFEPLSFNSAISFQNNILALFEVEHSIVRLLGSRSIVASVAAMWVLIVVERLQNRTIHS